MKARLGSPPAVRLKLARLMCRVGNLPYPSPAIPLARPLESKARRLRQAQVFPQPYRNRRPRHHHRYYRPRPNSARRQKALRQRLPPGGLAGGRCPRLLRSQLRLARRLPFPNLPLSKLRSPQFLLPPRLPKLTALPALPARVRVLRRRAHRAHRRRSPRKVPHSARPSYPNV